MPAPRGVIMTSFCVSRKIVSAAETSRCAGSIAGVAGVGALEGAVCSELGTETGGLIGAFGAYRGTTKIDQMNKKATDRRMATIKFLFSMWNLNEVDTTGIPGVTL